MPPQPRTIAFAPGERNVFLHLLTACNLACRHCYINPAEHGTATLDIAVVRDWLGLFFDPGKENNLVLLGGEPTLHPHLDQAVAHANRLGYHSVTIDSNGYLFHDILDRITPAQAVLSFSLDGPSPAINDPIRGDGVFRVCTDNIRRAKAKGFAVSVITTVSRANIDGLDHMVPLLAGLGVDRYFIQVIGLRGRAAGAGAEAQLTYDEWLARVPPVAARAAAAGMTVIYPKVFLDPDEPFQCAGNVADNFFIFPNGRVYQCPLCEDYPVHSFRIEDGRLMENPGLTERRFFALEIPEGCVMNKLLQPDAIPYDKEGRPLRRVSCVLLKNRLDPTG